MDERQTQIKEGAGLEESRLNRDLIDFLQRASTPVSLIIILIAVAWFAWDRWQAAQLSRVDAAYAALVERAELADNPSPASLRDLRDSYGSVGSVGALADLRLARAYLSAARRGVFIGAQPGLDGSFDEADLLDAEGVADYLDDAAGLYRLVAEATEADPGRAVIAINALFGLAAVAESRGDGEAARAAYERAAALAEASGLAGLDTVAAERMASIDAALDAAAPQPLDLYARFPGETRPGDEAETSSEPPAAQGPALPEGGGDEPATGAGDGAGGEQPGR